MLKKLRESISVRQNRIFNEIVNRTVEFLRIMRDFVWELAVSGELEKPRAEAQAPVHEKSRLAHHRESVKLIK